MMTEKVTYRGMLPLIAMINETMYGDARHMMGYFACPSSPLGSFEQSLGDVSLVERLESTISNCRMLRSGGRFDLEQASSPEEVEFRLHCALCWFFYSWRIYPGELKPNSLVFAGSDTIEDVPVRTRPSGAGRIAVLIMDIRDELSWWLPELYHEMVWRCWNAQYRLRPALIRAYACVDVKRIKVVCKGFGGMFHRPASMERRDRTKLVNNAIYYLSD